MKEIYLKFHFEPFWKIKLNLEDKKKLLIINEKKGNERNLPEVPFRTLPKDEAKSRRYKKLFIINKKIQKKRNSKKFTWRYAAAQMESRISVLHTGRFLFYIPLFPFFILQLRSNFFTSFLLGSGSLAFQLFGSKVRSFSFFPFVFFVCSF